MPQRPAWSGHIRIALVSIPVEIFTATRSGSPTAFRQIHEPSGQPIHYEKVVNGIGPVDTDDIRRGFEFEKGRYVLLEDDEIEAVRLETRKTIDLSLFVDAGAIPVLYAEKPYYVVPADDLAEEAYIVLREALKSTNRAGIGQLAMRGRESLVALRCCGRGLVLEVLRYADEVHKAQDYFRDIPDSKPDAALLELAVELIEKRTGAFDPDAYRDRYVEALHELVERKRRTGKKIVEPEDRDAPETEEDLADLLALLRKSLKSGAAPRTSRRARAAPARTARRGAKAA